MDDGTLVHEIAIGQPAGPVQFIESSRRVAVTTNDGLMRTYTLDPDELLNIARARVSRGFTRTECLRYRLDPCPTLADTLARGS